MKSANAKNSSVKMPAANVCFFPFNSVSKNHVISFISVRTMSGFMSYEKGKEILKMPTFNSLQWERGISCQFYSCCGPLHLDDYPHSMSMLETDARFNIIINKLEILPRILDYRKLRTRASRFPSLRKLIFQSLIEAILLNYI